MSEPDWNTMDPDQNLQSLYELFRALFIEAAELEARVNMLLSATEITTLDVK